MTFTEEKYQELKKAYNQAIKDKKDSFIFEGQEIITGYAKYLLEYLKGKFDK